MSLRGAYAGFGDANDPVRKIALQMRSLCSVNSAGSIFPPPKENDEEFPEVDSDEVFIGIFVGNA